MAGRRRRLTAGLGLGLALFGAAAAAAESGAPLNADVAAGRTHFFEQFFQSGVARMGRGDPDGALGIFETGDAIAPAMAEMHYAVAAARLVAHFSERAAALPAIRRALAAEPDHPLYRIVALLIDPAASELRDDGALYFTAEAAARLHAAAVALPAARAAYNGRYLATLLARVEPSGDAALPQRLPGFAGMLGEGRPIRLPHIAEPQSLGRLLALAIPEAAFRPYEARFVEHLRESRIDAPPPGATRYTAR